MRWGRMLGGLFVFATACGTFLSTSDDDETTSPPPVVPAGSSGDGGGVDGGGATEIDAAIEASSRCVVSTECGDGRLCFPGFTCEATRGTGDPCQAGWQCTDGICFGNDVNPDPAIGPVGKCNDNCTGQVRCCLGERPNGGPGSCGRCGIRDVPCATDADCCRQYACGDAGLCTPSDKTGGIRN